LLECFKTFCIIVINILHHYFDGLTKLFSDLYLAKFLNTLAKPLFLWSVKKMVRYSQKRVCNCKTWYDIDDHVS